MHLSDCPDNYQNFYSAGNMFIRLAPALCTGTSLFSSSSSEYLTTSRHISATACFIASTGIVHFTKISPVSTFAFVRKGRLSLASPKKVFKKIESGVRNRFVRIVSMAEDTQNISKLEKP